VDHQASDRYVLGAGLRDDHGTGLCSQGADRAGTPSGWSDAARDIRERPRVGWASLHRHCPGGRKGGRAGPRSAQLPWRIPLRWYLISLLVPLLILLIAITILYGLGPLRALAQNWVLLFTAFLPALAIMTLLNNVAEEIG
jgi:hypothetical protein